MSIFLSVAGTLVFIAIYAAVGNIYDVTPAISYAARWAVVLWLGTLDALLFGAAVWLLKGAPPVCSLL